MHDSGIGWEPLVQLVLAPLVGGLLYLFWSTRRELSERITRTVVELHKLIDGVEKDMAALRVSVAQDYASTKSLERMEDRLTTHMDTKFRDLGREIGRLRGDAKESGD